MSKHTETIDRYLSGQMSADEKNKFEQELQTNSDLQKEFELQRQVMKGISRHGMKSAAKKGIQKGSFRSRLFKWGTAIVIASAASVLVWMAKDKLFSSQQNNVRYELNEENKKEWADADKYLESQVFEISGSRDTVIETASGMVIAVPAGAFYDKFGAEVKDKFEIEIKEALDPAAMLKAGLSTTSDGKLLETGGMFYINARQNGENLNIAQNKGLYASVPTDKVKEGMQLFEGKRMENGQINWVNPQPLETNIPTVDITALNFYPPHFLDSVASFGFDKKNKRVTDSIYYSLECGSDVHLKGLAVGERADSSYRRTPLTLAEKLKMETDAKRIADSIAHSIEMELKKIGVSVVQSNSQSSETRASTLFKQNCAVCHTLTDQKLTGPGLKGIKERAPKGDWLFNYIKNNEKMIKSGDPYANKIFRDNGNAAMTVFEGTLSDDEIRALAAYIGSPSFMMENTGSSSCEIAPSRIRAIWDPKYNGTILATPQFEERLRVIFKTCNPGILDLYVNNLNAKFYELDEQAAKMCEDKPECQHKFEEFASRKDGGVSIGNDHLKKLSAFFEEKTRLYREAALKAMRDLRNKEEAENIAAEDRRNSHTEYDVQREQRVLKEEIQANLREAYRQLGKPLNPTPPARNYYAATVTSPGWKNVDAYVVESTMKRETLSYTDSATGRKAVIKYEPLIVTVAEASGYDRVYSYLLPDKLSSFQRMNATSVGGRFEEKLNETINYDLVVLAYRGNKCYFEKQTNIKPGNISLKLDTWHEMDLTSLFNAPTYGRETDFLRELKFQATEQKETLRQKAIMDRDRITLQLQRTVFPCLVLK